MFNKQRFVKLLQAMQKTNTSCARTFARFAGFEDVSKSTVISLVTDEAFFETMCKTHQITKENKNK